MNKIHWHPLLRLLFVTIIVLCLLVGCMDVDPTTERPLNKTFAEGITSDEQTDTPEEKANFSEKDLRYDDRTVKLTYHARCRMDCRHITAYEIQEILNKKQLNEQKTDREHSPGECPALAYEGRTSADKQKIRVILGDCLTNPIIITVIDLENEYQCSCK